jgi:hypothetical protein
MSDVSHEPLIQSATEVDGAGVERFRAKWSPVRLKTRLKKTLKTKR